MLRQSRRCAAVSMHFFNEKFFRVKQRVALTPSNTAEMLRTHFPADCRLLPKWRTRFLVASEKKVLGIVRPPLCLPIIHDGEPGGATIGEYLQFLEENKDSNCFLMVASETRVALAIVGADGQPVVDAQDIIALPNRDESISISSEHNNNFFNDVFDFIVSHQDPLLQQCNTMWHLNYSHQRNLLKEIRDKARTSDELRELVKLDFHDKRWIHASFSDLPRSHVCSAGGEARAVSAVGATRHGELLLSK